MWQVAEAKNKFSELLTRAETEGPQEVTRRGRTFVVLSGPDYARLTKKDERMPLGKFLLAGPSLEGLDLERRKSPMRPVDLE